MPNRWEQIITSLYGQRFGFNHEGDLVVDGATVATFKRDTAGQIVGLLNTDGTSIILPIVLAQSAIPFVLPSSGTFTGGTGALSGLTALPTTYSGGCFMFFPAGAGLPQGAGWYWTIMSSTTAGTVYNNVYSSGDPKLASPGYATAGTAITSGATSYTQTTSATADISGPIITVPGGSMGPNGTLDIFYQVVVPNNANAKPIAIKESGASLSTSTGLASVAGNKYWYTVQNRNNQAVNVGQSGVGVLAPGNSPLYFTRNTAADTLWAIAFEIATATDYIVIERFEFQVKYGA